MNRDLKISTPSGVLTFSGEDAQYTHLDTSKRKVNTKQIVLFIHAYLSLLSDSPLNTRGSFPKPARVYSKFFRVLTGQPLVTTITSYASLAHEIVSSTRLTQREVTSTGEFCATMKNTPIFKEYHEWYRTRNPELLQYVLSFLLFGKKLDYADASLQATAFRGWLDIEEKLSGLILPAWAKDLRPIVGSVVGFRLHGDLLPVFGPKAVAEPDVRGVISKSSHVRYSAKVNRVFFGLEGLFARTEERGFRYDRVLPDPDAWTRDGAAYKSSDVAKLRFVPKDVVKARSICMEPNTYMWAQQAVRAMLQQGLKSSSVGRRFVDINDQSRNRELARYGSVFGTVDTLDLSSASDSVSTELVKTVFPREVLYFLLGTRTSKVKLPDGRVTRVKKFAPMGSAVCFPVQSILFASVVIGAAMQHAMGAVPGSWVTPPYLDDVEGFVDRHFCHETGSDGLLGKRYEPGVVYGDDIILDHRLTAYAVPLLGQLGFSVNTEKSFKGQQGFRESCGGWYWLGYDVTPLIYRVKGYSSSLSSKTFASMVACANHAGDRRYAKLRRTLIHRLLYDRLEDLPKFRKNPIAFVEDRSLFGIFTTRARNEHLQHQPNIDWQVDEVQCIMPGTVGRKGPSSDHESDCLERYLRVLWWNGHRVETECVDSYALPRYVTGGTRLTMKWIRGE